MTDAEKLMAIEAAIREYDTALVRGEDGRIAQVRAFEEIRRVAAAPRHLAAVRREGQP